MIPFVPSPCKVTGAPIFAVRFRQPEWAPTFLSQHKSKQAAMRAALRIARRKHAGVIEVVEL